MKEVRNGKVIDQNGNQVDPKSPESTYQPMNTNTDEQINSLWRKNVYAAIKNISDLDAQRQIWLGNSVEFQSSFDEYIMNLYNDFDFGKFIINHSKVIINLSKELLNEMDRLNILINNFDKNKTDSEVLLDHDWYNITVQAKKIISIWDREAF